MKKFLSLLLALIMTMSLVTISAGATEYEDLTDKDELGPQYEEAVAVLNKIGVITGYDDGSFRPDVELTRGAAAKIIVSLLIGPEAANNLPNNSAPYPDVPANHTFAGVISFCKTKGIISGYGDGTFKPANDLTGYAFAKMLLGALGYDSDIEGFTGSGWVQNVGSIGNVAGLFDRLDFKGSEAVSRKDAALLALNTLKATMVTYGGTSLINGTTGSYTIQGTEANPVTSNNRDINANIGRKDWYGGNNKGSDYLTLEFGEEHFKDLRLEHDRYDPAHDDFGRPSNEWSYKKVTIGTFPLTPDFTYTTQVAHVRDTDGTKEKALGLRNYDLFADGGYSIWNGWGNDGTSLAINGGTTDLWLNGKEYDDYFATKTSDGKYQYKVANIADFTDNGTLVEVYVSYVDADWITDVVVIQTQLMEIKRVGSDYVSLDRVEPDMKAGQNSIGFNQPAIHAPIEQVKDTNEECYEILSGLKAGDEVAVVPVTTDDGKTYEAAEVYVPETVSGALTRVDTYGIGRDDDKERGAVEITVGGTSYKIADWNLDMWDIKAAEIKATRKDVTLLLDKYGNALKAKDVGATNDFMVIGNYYQALSGNKVCTFVHGWDISGNEIDLNLGSSLRVNDHFQNGQNKYEHVLGELVYYTSDGATGDAEYVLKHITEKNGKGVYDIYTNMNKNSTTEQDDRTADGYEIKASNLLAPLAYNWKDDGTAINGTYADGVISNKATHSEWNNVEWISRYYDKGVKFIYVTYTNGEDEIDNIEFKSGVQNVSNDELRTTIMGWAAQAAVKDDTIRAVVIKSESADASLDHMLYVTDTKGSKEIGEDGTKYFEVEVAMFTANGFEDEQWIVVDKDLQIGDFAIYNKATSAKYEENYYHVKQFLRHNVNPSALRIEGVKLVTDPRSGEKVKHLLEIEKAYAIGSKTALTKNDTGTNATDTESYVMGMYRGQSGIDSLLPAEARINTSKAEWLNLTDETKYDDIQSAEDLLKIAGNGVSANVTIDMLVNEKPDSDGFRTAYLMVIKKVGSTTPTGPSTPTIGEGEIDLLANNVPGAKISKIVPASRGSELALTIDLPSQGFIATGATTDVDLIVTIDGTEETVTATGLKVGSNRFVTSTLGLNGDEKISVRPAHDTKTDLVWSAVNVKYFTDSSAAANEIPASHMGTGTSTTLTTAGVGATSFKFSLIGARGYADNTAAWTAENATEAITTTRLSGATMIANAAAALGGSASETIAADGTDFVNIVITGVTKSDPKFTVAKSATFDTDHAAIKDAVKQATPTAAAVDKFGVTGGGNTLAVEWDKSAAVAAGSTVTFKATVAAGTPVAGKDFASYAVEIDTNYGKYTIAKAVIGTPGTVSVVIDADKGDLVINNVTAKGVDPLLDKTKIGTELSADGFVLTITFNAGVEITGHEALTTTEITLSTPKPTTNTISKVEHTAGSKVVTVTFSEPLETDAVITIDSDAVLNAVYNTDVLDGTNDVVLTYDGTKFVMS